MPDTQISEEMVRAAATALAIAAGENMMWPAYVDQARAALDAALSGHVVVPREPTDAMRIAGAHIHDQRPSEAASIYRAMIQAAPPVASGHVVGWRTMDSAPKDGTWILIADDHCWPPDLVRWQPERPRRTINGNNHLAIPAGWFGSPGGRSRFDVPDGHLMKATRWQPLPVPEMEG